MLPPQRSALTWADFSEAGFLRDPLASSTSTVGNSSVGHGSPGTASTIGHGSKSGEWSLDGALQFDNVSSCFLLVVRV